MATAEDEVRRKTAEVEREQEARKREIQSSVDRLEAYETEIKRRLKSFLEQQIKGLDALVEKPAAAPVQAQPTQDAQPADERLHAHPARHAAPPEQDERQPESADRPPDDVEPAQAQIGGEAGFIDVMDDEIDFEGYVREADSDTRRRPLRTLFRRNDREGEEWAEESTR